MQGCYCERLITPGGAGGQGGGGAAKQGKEGEEKQVTGDMLERGGGWGVQA